MPSATKKKCHSCCCLCFFWGGGSMLQASGFRVCPISKMCRVPPTRTTKIKKQVAAAVAAAGDQRGHTHRHRPRTCRPRTRQCQRPKKKNNWVKHCSRSFHYLAFYHISSRAGARYRRVGGRGGGGGRPYVGGWGRGASE